VRVTKGSIHKKKKIYYVVIPVDGKQKWVRGGTTKADAQAILNQMRYEIDNKTYQEIPEITFKEFTQLWLRDHVEGNLKPSTTKGYKDILNKNLSVFNDRLLSSLTTVALQGYVRDRRDKVSAKTVCNEIVVMKELFKHARKWGYVKVSPAEDVERPKTNGREIEILTPNEIRVLLEKTHPHYKAAFLTAFLTGMRAGELWALRWSDVDWNSNRIHVRQSVWQGKFQAPKTRKSVRKIDLLPQLIYELKKWKLVCPHSSEDLVFPGIEGGIANHVNTVNRHLYPALRRAGLRHVSFHSLRHSNASFRIHAGQNIKYISEQLGHASIRITLDTYGHLFEDMDFTSQQVGLLEASFGSVRKPLEDSETCSKTHTQKSDFRLEILGV
jgi:integrase